MGGCLLLFWLLRIMRIFEHSLHTRLYCICIVHSWSNMVSGSENVDHYVYREHCIPLHAHIENRNRNVIIYTVPKIVMLIYMYTVPNIIWLLFPYIWHTNKIYICMRLIKQWQAWFLCGDSDNFLGQCILYVNYGRYRIVQAITVRRTYS